MLQLQMQAKAQIDLGMLTWPKYVTWLSHALATRVTWSAWDYIGLSIALAPASSASVSGQQESP